MTEQSVHIYAAILHGVKEGVNSTEANSDDFSHIAYIQALAAIIVATTKYELDK